ncbi:MAG: hypothetical protein A2X13_04880 [Bacteroidetes bacterium GWC2_33_15]|nr:MAG: hypothetical protein A2X10_12750 [Bacteroidetes bacterium GWA2_33_15]OFX50928.1 MAG: hypothetical protein A2X13_04880 [Bacteroidetes bacterium GWC2_33_15]OFX66567.1 MAG: hypothetical protein A2X15_15480 [Bacteroidetes bacterium GWB2_32_14]OFX70154.1 MAG: hypothetical protein A2X14_12640 [Bacteroidetes bacterium GWD2_33_33]HAN20035.1 hypothetical protein [Bacteroidales bacterium]
MKTHSTQKSVFAVLFFRIVITILLLNSVLAIINIRDAIKIQQQSEATLRDKIRDEIIGLSDFQTSALKTFEKSFYDLQKGVLEKMASEADIEDLRTENLTNRLRSMGLDTVFHDLYIIEENIIVNTTYLPDWGLDFSAFGNERIALLDRIQKSKTFFAEKFQFESSTKRLRSYSYQATKDGKFIIEIGSYSEVADKIMEMFRTRLKKISEENENIVSVNYWFGNAEYQFPIIDEALNRYIPDSIITDAFNQKKDITADFTVRDQEMNIEFMYVKQDPATRLPDFALSVITDNTNRMAPVYKIIQRQVFFTFFFLILIIGIIYLATRSLKE